MKKLLYYSLAWVLLLAIGPQAEAQRKKSKNKEKKSAIEENVAMLRAMAGGAGEEEAMESFVEGMKYFVLEEYQKALPRFEESRELSPENATVYFQLAKTYRGMGKYGEATVNAEKALSFEKSNPYFYLLLANLYEDQREFSKAIGVFKQLIAASLAHKEDYLSLAHLYLMTNNAAEALATYNQIDEKYGFDERIVRQKQRIYLRSNRIDKAIEEGERLVRMFPNTQEYVMEQAQLLMSDGQIDKSIFLLEKVLEDSPEQVSAKFILSDAYQKKGDQAKAQQLLEEAISSPLMDFPAKADVLTGYLRRSGNPEERAKGLQLAEMVVKAHPDEAKAHAMQADLLMTENTKASKVKARSAYLSSVRLDGDNFAAWQQINAIDWEMEETDSLVKHTEMALEFFPNQATLYLQHGVGQMLKGNHEAAVDAFEHGKMISMGNDALKMQFNSYLGDVYHRMESHVKSDMAFEEVLASNPDDLHALNNYSYFLSLRKENLEKAKEMGKKLVALAPDNATYLDTYGWVLYVAEDYEEARKYLEKAALNSDSGTVLEHYGDVLYQLGDKQGAIEQWRKAKALGNAENPEQLEQKLVQGKLLE